MDITSFTYHIFQSLNLGFIQPTRLAADEETIMLRNDGKEMRMRNGAIAVSVHR